VIRRGTTIAHFVAGGPTRPRGSTFPVVEDGGQLTGLVSYRRVGAVPPARWSFTAVDDVALPAHDVPIAQPDELVLDVISRSATGDGPVVVLDHGRVVGIVSPVDITQVIQRFGLHDALHPGRPGP